MSSGRWRSSPFSLDYIELIRRGGSRIQATLGLLLEMAALAVAADRAGGPAVRDPVRDDARLLAADPQQRAGRRARRRRLGVAVSDPGGAGGAADRHRRGDDLQPGRLGRGGDLRKARRPHPAAKARTTHCCRPPDFGCGRATTPATRSSSTAPTSPRTTWCSTNVSIFFFDDHTRFASRIDARTARLKSGAWDIENGVRWRPDKPPRGLRPRGNCRPS